MRLTLPSVALLLPALLGNNVAFAACIGKADQILIQAEDKWNLTGFASTSCGQHSTTHSGDDDQGCLPLNGGITTLSYKFNGINKFKVCLWADADCSTGFYRGSTLGDKEQTCRNVHELVPVEAFTVIKSSKRCY